MIRANEIIAACGHQVGDAYGRLAGPDRDTGRKTLAQMKARLSEDTPENNRRNDICDAATAQIERAFGRKEKK